MQFGYEVSPKGLVPAEVVTLQDVTLDGIVLHLGMMCS